MCLRHIKVCLRFDMYDSVRGQPLERQGGVSTATSASGSDFRHSQWYRLGAIYNVVGFFRLPDRGKSWEIGGRPQFSAKRARLTFIPK